MQTYEERAEQMLQTMGGAITPATGRIILRRLVEAEDKVVDLQRVIEAADRTAETAESVAQMAAHDRDEALENFARVEREYEQLQQAARSILWMAREYAEAGGRGGPEMQDYEAAAEIIGESEGNGV